MRLATRSFINVLADVIAGPAQLRVGDPEKRIDVIGGQSVKNHGHHIGAESLCPAFDWTSLGAFGGDWGTRSSGVPVVGFTEGVPDNSGKPLLDPELPQAVMVRAKTTVATKTRNFIVFHPNRSAH